MLEKLEGLQPLGMERSCLEISRQLQRATWTAGPRQRVWGGVHVSPI